MGFSHLREHKFRHNFLDTLDPMCNCRTNAIESTEHFLLHCPSFSSSRKDLFDSLQAKNIPVLPYKDSFLVRIFLYGDIIFDDNTNREIIKSVIAYLIDTDRFNVSLFS